MTAQIIYLVRTPLDAWNDWNRLWREVQDNPDLGRDWDHLCKIGEAKKRAFGMMEAGR